MKSCETLKQYLKFANCRVGIRQLNGNRTEFNFHPEIINISEVLWHYHFETDEGMNYYYHYFKLHVCKHVSCVFITCHVRFLIK